MVESFVILVITILVSVIYFMLIDDKRNKEIISEEKNSIQQDAKVISESKMKARMLKENLEEFLQTREKFKLIDEFYLKKINSQIDRLNYINSFQFLEDLENNKAYGPIVSQKRIDLEYISFVNEIEREINSIKVSISIHESNNLKAIPNNWEKLDVTIKKQLEKDGISPDNINNLQDFTLTSKVNIDELLNFQNLTSLKVLSRNLYPKDFFLILSLPNIKSIVFKEERLNFFLFKGCEVPAKSNFSHLEISMRTYLEIQEHFETFEFTSLKLVINDVRVEELNNFFNIDYSKFSENIELNFVENKYRIEIDEFERMIFQEFNFNYIKEGVYFNHNGESFNGYSFIGRVWDDMYQFLYRKK